MTNRWRLINGLELYDMTSDSGQKTDVAGDHPAVVGQLRDFYEDRWKEFIDRDQAHPFNRAIIGSDKKTETMLAAIDWFAFPDPPYVVGQASVREGRRSNGAWYLEVAESGVYQFELRRWPREADAAIRATLPGITSEVNDIPLHKWGEKPEGRALDFISARIQAGGHDLIRPVGNQDKGILFSIPLSAGPVTLKTWFYTPEGEDWGAYYVYVTKTD
jgi:hypothetical protein